MPRKSTKAKGKKRPADKPKGTGKDSESAAAKKFKMAKTPGSSCSNSSGLKQYLKNRHWLKHLQCEFEKDYFKDLEKMVDADINSGKEVYPPKSMVFNALELVDPKNVKVLLLGQDPYHGEGQAHGLSFSVPPSEKIPPSLRNIYKELSSDIPGFKDPGHGCLEKWAKQGVLLLNATLTVRKTEPNSHSKFGWQTFTDQVIRTVSQESPDTVFMLWGNFAHKKEKLVDTSKHVVLKDAHPSPLSFTKFSGCKCFSRANEALEKMGRGIVDW